MYINLLSFSELSYYPMPKLKTLVFLFFNNLISEISGNSTCTYLMYKIISANLFEIMVGYSL